MLEGVGPDGGGFGGTNSDGRVSLGFARVEGTRRAYRGVNIWGGKSAHHRAAFGGKCYGIISLRGDLYAWVGPGSGTESYREARLHRSTDKGASWSRAPWAFVKAERLIMPAILNFGRDGSGARDGYVYHYFIRLQGDPTRLGVHRPGKIDLARVPSGKIMERGSYEFFAGLDPGGAPRWTRNVSERRAVFEDAAGVGWSLSVSFNAGIGRYLLITEHTRSFEGRLGMFDAPAPWGPWTTVLYTESFGAGAVERSTFYWNFAGKWSSAGGRRFVLVFSGTGSNDSWNTVEGEFAVAEEPAGAGKCADPGEPRRSERPAFTKPPRTTP